MSCEICGRNNCCRSFHSLEEQREFDEVIEPYKDSVERKFDNGIRDLDYRCKDEIEDDDFYVKLSDVKEMVSNIL